jgi:multidrug resistance protein MdtO
VILWTVLIASLPGYGATVRKMGLRLLGALAGGLITLLVIIVVSTSYDSLLIYLLVVLAVTWIGTYVAQSSERLSYAGIQLTNTFLVLYVALEPKTSEYDALWRFWGIVLGTLAVALVELIVWPEHTAPRLRSALGRAMRTAATLLQPGQPGTAPQLRRGEINLLVELRHAAGLAGEARL